MPVPKKPNRRRTKKTRHVMTPEEEAQHSHILHLRRHDQAIAIRNKIVGGAGDILHEIPMFLDALGDWVRYGRMRQGKCHIASANRTMEWILHDNISRVPEVWIRAPDYESKDRETDYEINEVSTDGGVHE